MKTEATTIQNRIRDAGGKKQTSEILLKKLMKFGQNTGNEGNSGRCVYRLHGIKYKIKVVVAVVRAATVVVVPIC